MNRKLLLAAAALALTVVISSCNKEKETFVNATPAAPVLTADEQDITLNIETNAPSWTAKFKYGNWVKIAYKGEESIIIKMEPNVGLTDRTDSLVITAKDVILTVPVKQQSLLSILSSSGITLKGTDETSFNITSKNAWTIDMPEWLRVNPNAGIGPATIKVSAFTEHEDVDNRSGKLKITFGGKYYNMPVVQPKKDVIYVSGAEKVDVDAFKAEITVGTRTNVDYTVEIDEACKSWISWKSAVQTKALREFEETFDISANDTFEEREGKIVFKYGDAISQSVTVIQKGKDPILKETAPGLYTSSGNTVYEPGKCQLSRSYKSNSNSVSFRILFPESVKAIEFTGLTKDIKVGDKFNLTVQEVSESGTKKNVYETVVLQVENSLVWLKCGTRGFIVKI